MNIRRENTIALASLLLLAGCAVAMRALAEPPPPMSQEEREFLRHCRGSIEPMPMLCMRARSR